MGKVLESVNVIVNSNPGAFVQALEKLFEDESENKTISIMVGYDYENEAICYKATFLGDIQRAKIIKYIRERLN